MAGDLGGFPAEVLLRAATDAMVDPQALLEAVRDDDERIIDFIWREANPAACAAMGLDREELIGTALTQTAPLIADSGLLARYAECLATGEPMSVEDLDYPRQGTRRFDIRAARSSSEWLSLVWRDVTDRYEAQQEVANAEEHFRLLLENSSDIVVQFRDYKIAWISPSVTAEMGAPPSYWIGRYTVSLLAPEDLPKFGEMLAETENGATSVGRLRAFDASGALHWLEVRARLYYDAEGRPDGHTASLRLIDDEVAAERAAAQARKQQADSDARFRRLMENSSVGMSLNSPDGRFVEVNQALCDFLGYDTETLCTKTWQEVTAPATLEVDIRQTNDLAAGIIDNYRTMKQFIHSDGHLVWADLSASCIREANGDIELFVAQFIDMSTEVELRAQQAESDTRFRRLMETSNVGMAIATPDGKLEVVNQALCEMLGYDEETFKTKSWQDITPAKYLDADLANIEDLLEGRLDTYRVIKEHLHADGHGVWTDVSASCIRDPSGEVQYLVGQLVDITEQVEARARQAEADARFRRLMETSNVAMALVTPEGKMDVVNEALCQLFGYDEETLKSKTWQELTPARYLETDLESTADLLAGRLDTYRVTKEHIHADGHLIWVDLSVSCLRDAAGAVQYLVAQGIDISEEVEAQERLAHQERENRLLADLLKAEIRSAADYVESILPDDLHGPVEVASRYLPSLDLGGDGFYYHWLDDDHLNVYLFDVSGHGIKPAFLCMSVHNLMRSGSLSDSVLLNPDRVLDAVNRMFPMEDQGENYFTIWYGIYQLSTRTLRYASAGHPPALAFVRDGIGVTTTRLATVAGPIGMFPDSVYTTDCFSVPEGMQLLLYSDGAFELPFDGAIGRSLLPEEFFTVCTDVAARPDWSLDELVDRLRTLSPSGDFEDDCALVLLTFP